MPKNSKGTEVAEVLSDTCMGCQICVAECPVGAIEMVDGVARIDPEVCIGCGKCKDVCPVDAVRFEKKRRKTPKKEKIPQPVPSPYQGVAVFIEAERGDGATVSWELIGKARELATKRETSVIGLLLGHRVDRIAQQAISYGCDQIHLIDDPLLERYRSKPFGKGLSDLCAAIKPEILLIGATPLGRDLSGIVATIIETGLTADCTALDIDEETGLLLMTRPTFGGNIMATIFCQHHRPQMSTVRPRVFPLPEPDNHRTSNIQRYDFVSPEGPLPEVVEQIANISQKGVVDITRFPALVVAGKGACDPSTFPILDELAQVVGGTVACSRPVVEAGLMPYERQVGQTGKTVAPKLYIGVGVSGAVQHLVGMQGSEKILAINEDPHAPIFRVADVCLVGDYKKIVPELTKQLGSRIRI